jgi:hypothetical protein
MFRPLTGLVAAATLVTGFVTPAQVRAQYYGGGYYGGGCYAGEWPSQCRDRLRWERSRPVYVYPDNRYYGRRRHRDSTGAAIAGGIIGFALGAAIAGSQSDRRYYASRRGDRSWAARCARRYRSFDPYSGTYLSNSGYRRILCMVSLGP